MARLPECSWAFLTGSARTGGSRRRSFHGTLPLLYKLRSVQGREAEGHPGARVHPLRAQEPSGFEDVRVVRRVAGAPARRHQHGEHERLQHAVARPHLVGPCATNRCSPAASTGESEARPYAPRRCWRTSNAPHDEKRGRLLRFRCSLPLFCLSQAVYACEPPEPDGAVADPLFGRGRRRGL